MGFVRSNQLLDDRPVCPYSPGFETNLYPHVPSPPFMGSLMDANDYDFFQTRTRFQAVLDRPPRGQQRSSQSSVKIKIVKALRVGRAAGAQVVLCDVEGASQPKFQAIAKIYDALYYRLAKLSWGEREKDREWLPRDVMLSADGDYCREASAYMKLQAAGLTEGSLTPTYHGSWTFQLDVSCPTRPKVSRRDVRLILFEQLQGSTMLEISMDCDKKSTVQKSLTEDYRLFIWSQYVEAIVKCEHADVYHDDLYERNIMVAPVPQKRTQLAAQPRPRVTIFDFNLIKLWDPPSDATISAKKLPLSPVMRFWDSAEGWDFKHWLPQWWKDDQKRREWLLEQLAGDRVGGFQALPQPLDLKKDSWDQPGYREP